MNITKTIDAKVAEIANAARTAGPSLAAFTASDGYRFVQRITGCWTAAKKMDQSELSFRLQQLASGSDQVRVQAMVIDALALLELLVADPTAATGSKEVGFGHLAPVPPVAKEKVFDLGSPLIEGQIKEVNSRLKGQLMARVEADSQNRRVLYDVQSLISAELYEARDRRRDRHSDDPKDVPAWGNDDRLFGLLLDMDGMKNKTLVDSTQVRKALSEIVSMVQYIGKDDAWDEEAIEVKNRLEKVLFAK